MPDRMAADRGSGRDLPMDVFLRTARRAHSSRRDRARVLPGILRAYRPGSAGRFAVGRGALADRLPASGYDPVGSYRTESRDLSDRIRLATRFGE